MITRVAPAERGRPHEVLAYIDAIDADHMRSYALQFPGLSGSAKLRLLRADSITTLQTVVEMLEISTRMIRLMGKSLSL